jgi:hypothetical protein
MPQTRRSRGLEAPATSTTTTVASSDYTPGGDSVRVRRGAVDSQQAAWWPVHQFVAALVAQSGALPGAGTPAWCALSDGDPRKLLALAVEGEHVVLFREIAQEARAEASKAVAAAADWPAVARQIQQLDAARRSGARIERSAHVGTSQAVKR